MLHLYAHIMVALVTAGDTAARTWTALKNDRGSVTVEQVLITLGLFIVAGALIAVITTVVNNHTAQIK